MNKSLNLSGLVSLTDNNNKSLITKKEQLSWITNSDENDVLKITNIELEPEKNYVIRLSEKITNNDGLTLQGKKEYTFSTRKAAYLTFEPTNPFHALSSLRFKINGGIITDVSKAVVSLSYENVKGKCCIEGNYIVYKLDSGYQWPFGTDVIIKLSNLTDIKSAKISDFSATFTVLKQTEISSFSKSENLRDNITFSYSNGLTG